MLPLEATLVAQCLGFSKDEPSTRGSPPLCSMVNLAKMLLGAVEEEQEAIEKENPVTRTNSSASGESELNNNVRASSSNSNTMRFKTEMCRNFEQQNYCPYGDNCQFAHGKEEMHHAAENSKYKTKQCKTFWNHGYCPYGGRCQFLHFEKEQVKPKAIMDPEVLKKQGGLNFPEKSQDSAYNTSAESITPPKLSMLPPPPVPRYVATGSKEPVLLPPAPVPLELLHRPLHGSGRLGTVEKNGEFFWYDTYTQKYVSRV